ncbi:Dps family protein [Oceanobacillus sp. CAU 1775]
MQNQELIKFMNQLLSNYFILYVKLHRYHWYVKGHQFFQLHEIFEEFYEEFQGNLDELAEHIMVVGGKPLATMSMYLKQGTLEEANADDTEEEMISQLSSDLNKLSVEISQVGLPLTIEVSNSLSNDILIAHLKKIENKKWMLENYQGSKA